MLPAIADLLFLRLLDGGPMTDWLAMFPLCSISRLGRRVKRYLRFFKQLFVVCSCPVGSRGVDFSKLVVQKRPPVTTWVLINGANTAHNLRDQRRTLDMVIQQAETPEKNTVPLVRALLLSLGVGAGFAAFSALVEQPMPQAWSAFLREYAPALQIVGAVVAGLAMALPLSAAATTSRLRNLQRRAIALETRAIPLAREEGP
jgi:hypothetical protein